MSNRPTSLLKNGTLYWVLSVYDTAGELVDADSTPSVTVRKNGSAASESVTVTKRGSSTGLYDCSMNPSLEAEGDTFHIEEELAISSVTYNNTWSVVVAEPMITNAEVSTAVWDEPKSSHVASGSMGQSINTSDTLLAANYAVLFDLGGMIESAGGGAERFTTTALENGPIGGDATAASQTTIISNIAALNDFDPSSDLVTTDTASRDASKADVSGLSTFDASADQVVASNMRGTDGANTVTPNTVAPDNASITAILADTADLQTNQGQWLTATGFNTVAPDNAGITSNGTAIASLNDFDPATDVVGSVTTVGSVTNAVTTSNAADVTAIKGVTDKLDTALVLDGSVYQYTVNALENAPSGGSAPTEADIYLYFTQSNRQDTFKADTTLLATSASISALNDFDPATDVVGSVTTVGSVTNAVVTDAASRTASQADVSALATSSEISSLNNITVQQIWDSLTSGSYISGSFGERLLVSQGTHRTVQVTGSNHVAADVHEVQADGLTNSTEIAGIWSTLVADGAVYQFTTNALENAPSGSVSIPAIVDAVWDEERTGHTTANTFGYFLDAQVSGAGSGGTGLYQITVRVEDSSNNALQGARVNVDGTTLTLTTGSSGEVVFNLDSGVYLLNVSPPAGYTTPLGQVVTVTTADLSETFTLVGSGTCSPGWVG
jgi:hypothetical protein